MGFEIQSQTTQPNGNLSFQFTDAIQQWVVGISYFDLEFKKDHHVETASLSLSTSQLSDSVQVTVHAQIKDTSGNTIDVGASKIGVVAMAITGTNDPKTVMSNKNGIANGSESGSINLPGQTGFSVFTSFLSGFDLSYGSKDHHVEGAQATAGVTENGNLGFITSTASLYDESGNSAATANINGGFLASTNSSPGFFAQTVSKQTGSQFDVTMDKLKSVEHAIVLVQSWTVQYEDQEDHHVRKMGGGTTAWTTTGNKVILDNGQAFISDDSGNHQDNGVSSVKLLVIATGTPA